MKNEEANVATAADSSAATVLGDWPATPEEKTDVEAIRERLRKYGNEKLAGKLGCRSRTAVSNWMGLVPAKRVRAVSELTGIPMKELRPDLYDSHFRGRTP